MLNFTELLVVVNNWKRLVEVVLNSSFDGLSVVIRSTTGLGSLHASFEHLFLRDIVEEDLACFNNVFLEVNGLIKGSWESIKKVILKFEI